MSRLHNPTLCPGLRNELKKENEQGRRGRAQLTGVGSIEEVRGWRR
jgi:hypothetical protein